MKGQLFSHPGVFLEDHLKEVKKIGLKRNNETEISFDFNKDFDKLLKIILLSHDFGKATKYFQEKLKYAIDNENRKYKKLKNDPHTYHSGLSALLTYYILKNEFKNNEAPILGYIIVKNHHGNLKDGQYNFKYNNWDILNKQFEFLNISYLQDILDHEKITVDLNKFSVKEIESEWNHYSFKLMKLDDTFSQFNIKTYFLLNYTYSILVYSDKAEVIFRTEKVNNIHRSHYIFQNTKLDKDLTDKYRENKGWLDADKTFNQLRNLIYQEIIENSKMFNLDQKILSINVPTGTGKTVASFSTALKLKNRLEQQKNIYYNIIYTLPFTSIIEQNYRVFREILETKFDNINSNILIKHHYLSEKSYETEKSDNISYDIAEFLIEGWDSEIVISTFVQLLESILTNNNRRLKKFNNLVNSIIILDEVQAIPHKYWKLVKKVFEFLAEKYNCYFIFVTATMPLIFSEDKGEIKELAENKKDYFGYCNRIKLNLKNYNTKLKLGEFKEIIKEDLNDFFPEQSFLLIFNTIKSSTKVFDFINNELGYENVIYLSKNLINKEVYNRIKNIKNSSEPLIVVSTQLVEAGVDIDFDRVYRDIAPLDSINQSCGRCNRHFSEDKGEVIILRLIDDNDRLFASYVYSGFLLDMTHKILKNQENNYINEKDFYKLNKKYFNLVNNNMSYDESNDILKWLENLKYKKAFADTENKQRFKLIKNDYRTVELFIALNEDAQKIWDKYKDLQQIKEPWERKKEFEKIKEKFLDYIVTVSEKNAKKHFSEERLNENYVFVDISEIDTVYDIITGFENEVEDDYFF